MAGRYPVLLGAAITLMIWLPAVHSSQCDCSTDRCEQHTAAVEKCVVTDAELPPNADAATMCRIYRGAAACMATIPTCDNPTPELKRLTNMWTDMEHMGKWTCIGIPATGSTSRRSRKKRYILWPTTKWCGTGNTSSSYEDLGTAMHTDRCCRTHDHCPYSIGGSSYKYGYWNWRSHTVSDCDCDSAFRTCIKHARHYEWSAAVVGNIFNVVPGNTCLTCYRSGHNTINCDD